MDTDDQPELEQEIATSVAALAEVLQRRGWTMATAESCTGGLIAGACTDRPGSSTWFDRGFVTYSNAAKIDMLGVPAALLGAYGAVSDPVAHAMAEGACQRAATRVAVAVTGIAGPSGGSPEKPVGTVWFGWCVDGVTNTERQRFAGDRTAVRQQTVAHALSHLCRLLGGNRALVTES